MSNLVPCRSCAVEVSPRAAKCPQCGEAHPGVSQERIDGNKKIFQGFGVFAVVALFLAVIIAAVSGSNTPAYVVDASKALTLGYIRADVFSTGVICDTASIDNEYFIKCYTPGGRSAGLYIVRPEAGGYVLSTINGKAIQHSNRIYSMDIQLLRGHSYDIPYIFDQF